MAIILQMGLFDETKYPKVLKGILERTQGPAIQYVFVDTIEQARELKRRIVEGYSPSRAAFDLCDSCRSNQCFRGIHGIGDRNFSNESTAHLALHQCQTQNVEYACSSSGVLGGPGERHWVIVEWGSKPAAVPCRWHGGKTDPIKLKDKRLIQGMVNEGWTEVEPPPYDEGVTENAE